MTKRLLIVEDSELSRELLIQLFEDSYELVLAADGETAVKLARSTEPDLILMDISLRCLGGLDSARAIRADSQVPIVAASSRVMPGDREEVLEAGCDEFVPKPIDDLSLVELVRRLTTGR